MMAMNTKVEVKRTVQEMFGEYRLTVSNANLLIEDIGNGSAVDIQEAEEVLEKALEMLRRVK